ncbi:MAG: hypothetical protein ACTSW1_00120 [Candidatus Hodarchaeales archaeon]
MSLLEELKPHLEILEKIEKFEQKAEYNRFLLVLVISGFIVIIGGWISYIMNRFLGTDPTFFMFGLTGKTELSPLNEPILFSTVWLLYAIPILSTIALTTGSSSIVSWNKAYRKIGVIAISLFAIVQIIIIVLGIEFMKFIPGVWGIFVSLGFFLSSHIIFQETKIATTKKLLNFFGLMALFLGAMTSLFFPKELAMLFFGAFLGLTLSTSGFVIYLISGRM